VRKWAHLYNSTQWRKARKAYLMANPLCLHCYRRNCITTATDLDHITPHKGNAALFWDANNWQPLCKSCHSTKTATQDGGLGNKPKALHP